ncbi:MAG: HAMP domain-containing sensor histidine kinase [Eubacteriales bacterium]|nr:HAMP domain-containing sensor histidine kinase [Eubacteriales bacterium]
MSWKTAACILGVCLLASIAVFFYLYRKREKELDYMIAYLMKLQDGAELPNPEKQREGKMGILQSEIYKLMIRLNGQRDMEKSERKYLSDFLSDVSHQIKTPMAAITIMTDLLKDPGLSTEKRLEFVSNIDRETERIIWLIKNLLVLSQLEAGVLKLKKEKISVKELLESVMKSFEVMAEVKEIGLSMGVPSEGSSLREKTHDMFLVCDVRWTTEALSNIVKNCLEHTEPGGFVKIAVSQNNFSTNIMIRDNGKGIAQKDLPHIFERFYKASNSDASSVGIGLAMSRQIFLLQGATVSVCSREGEGTEFLIKFYPVKNQ